MSVNIHHQWLVLFYMCLEFIDVVSHDFFSSSGIFEVLVTPVHSFWFFLTAEHTTVYPSSCWWMFIFPPIFLYYKWYCTTHLYMSPFECETLSRHNLWGGIASHREGNYLHVCWVGSFVPCLKWEAWGIRNYFFLTCMLKFSWSY